MAYTPLNSSATPAVAQKPVQKLYDPNAKAATLDPALFAGFNPEDVQQTSDLLTAKFFPVEQEQKRGIDYIQDALGRDVDVEQTYGQYANQYLADVYNQLGEQLQQGVGRQQALYGGASQAIGQGYDAASQQAGTASQAIQASLASKANALGQGDTLTDPLARLNAEMVALQARTGASKAGAVGNMDTLGATMVGEGIKGIGSAQKQSTQQQADMNSLIAGNIGKLQTTAQKDTIEGLSKLLDTKTQKGAEASALLQQFKTARTERERQAAQDAWNQMMQKAQFDLQVRAQTATEQNNAREYELAAQKASSSDPMDQLDAIIKQQTIEKNQNELDDYGKGAGKEYSGNEGLTQWMQDSGKTGKFMGSIRRYIDAGFSTAANTGLDPYTVLRDSLNKSKNKDGESITLSDPAGKTDGYTFSANDVMKAIDVYFKGSGKAK